MVPSLSISYSWKAPIPEVRLIGIDGSQRTFQLFLQTASTSDTECTNKLFKINLAALVFIKDVENIISKFGRIAKGKELFVYPAKFCLIEMTRWTVFLKTLVPVERLAKYGKIRGIMCTIVGVPSCRLWE